VVKRGDTLYSIALEHGASYRDVAQWNQLDDPTKISIGQVLRVTAPEAEGGVQIGAARASGPLVARPLEGAGTAPQGTAEGGTKTSPKALRLPYSDQNLALLRQGDAAASAVSLAASGTAASAGTAATSAAAGCAPPPAALPPPSARTGRRGRPGCPAATKW
jgi:lipoprotein NlpD